MLTGQLPFRQYKPQELAYYVSIGSRPVKPENAKEIGISDPLWALMQKCWEGKIGQRPRVQDVVKGLGRVAANWNTDMEPSGTEQAEDSYVEEDSDELKHGGFPSSPTWYQVLESSF